VDVVVDLLTAFWDVVLWLWEGLKWLFDQLNWLTDQIFLFLNRLFDRFGTPIVFFAALIEATAGLGLIFPGVALMFLGGAYSAGDWPMLALVLVLAVVGTMIGDTVSYGLGRWGSRFLAGTPLEPALRLGEVLIGGRTRWIIPFYHLHNMTRAVGPFGAGAIRIPLRVWVPLDYAGAVIANVIWVGAGALFGSVVLTDDGRLKEHPALRIGFIVVALVWVLVIEAGVRRRWSELTETVSAPEQTAE
jgi:membrane protein DedA with SNARE-associated domain